MWQHKEGVIPGFTSQYGVSRLVWFELHDTIENAATREKSMKRWRREWKVKLIEKENPEWEDLYEQLGPG